MAESSGYTANTSHSIERLNPTESEIFKALGDWMLTVLPAGFSVMQGQQNRTPTPLNPFAVMVIITRQRYGTNIRSYDDQTVTITQPLRMGIQVTTFGAGAGDAVVQLNTSWRDPDAVEWFRQNRPECAPCYASDPRQQAFVTAESQYQDTWSLDLILDVQTTITRPVESALELKPDLIQIADILPLEKKTYG